MLRKEVTHLRCHCRQSSDVFFASIAVVHFVCFNSLTGAVGAAVLCIISVVRPDLDTIQYSGGIAQIVVI